MRTIDLIESLTILEKYRDCTGFDIGAEHDIIYAYATNQPVEGEDLLRLVELGWFQEVEDVVQDGDFLAEHYDPEELWACYV